MTQQEAIKLGIEALDEAYDRLEEEGYKEEDDTVVSK